MLGIFDQMLHSLWKKKNKCDNYYEYKHFWTGRIEQHNPLNSDTERPTDENRVIEAIENKELGIDKNMVAICEYWNMKNNGEII